MDLPRIKKMFQALERHADQQNNVLLRYLVLELQNEVLGDVIDGLTRDERTQVEGGLIIDAIKAVRTRTGLGLREAKDVVDAYLSKHGRPKA